MAADGVGSNFKWLHHVWHLSAMHCENCNIVWGKDRYHSSIFPLNLSYVVSHSLFDVLGGIFAGWRLSVRHCFVRSSFIHTKAYWQASVQKEVNVSLDIQEFPLFYYLLGSMWAYKIISEHDGSKYWALKSCVTAANVTR